MSNPSTQLRVAIVDDHGIVRTGLRQFLSEQDDFIVVGEAANGREAVDLVRTVAIDVLVMDLSMPVKSGIDVLGLIRSKAPDVRVLVLSGFPEDQFAASLIRKGASGYLNKECDPAEIVVAIRAVATGRLYISRAVAEGLAERMAEKTDSAPHDDFTHREMQVFLRLAKGETPGEIANSLALSVRAVSTNRAQVLRKLGLDSNSELTYYAIKNKLIQ